MARATGISRRAADQAISDQRVQVNGQPAVLGQEVSLDDSISLDGGVIRLVSETTTIMLNKPAGYVCSRQGQGSKTVYDLLPAKYHNLKPAGRLDKDSSGLLLLTNDGALANRLTHPSFGKQKEYQVELDKPLSATDAAQLATGINLADGPSKLQIKNLQEHNCTVSISEGRNRQIRRSFMALGYNVTNLHRTRFGGYELGSLPPGKTQII